MNYKTLLAILAIGILAIGCGNKEDDAATTTPDATSSADKEPTPDVNAGGVAGTYVATAPGGGTMTIVLADDNTFTTTSAAGSGKGTYAKDGDKLTLTILETDGKPASEEDKKNALVVTVSANGSTLDGPADMDFKKQ